MTTTEAPLELLGASAGLSIVDPGTVLTRLWFFDGKFLRAEGLRLDQDYVRSLVGLANQACGSGVVHGLDAAAIAGDRLRVEAGLALAPSGRVVYLSRRVEVSIAQLISRSLQGNAGVDPPAAGQSSFGRCPPDRPVAPDLTVPAHPVYVLTVSSVEALCGEEERFGRLCADACATESDRSTVVEGVCLRVRELTLTLPTSTAVPFADRHLRSRVASAYFEQERLAVPSFVSGAGLRGGAWCVGATGIGGEEVPLAVLDRAGAVTSFVDGWTARRELIEPTPRRYWAARMAMRPWDVFLAQVLQFQCQLLDLGAPGPGTPQPPDPCADERDTLAAAGQVLTALPDGLLDPGAAARVAALRQRITEVLSGPPPVSTASGSLLVDGGIVGLPPGGYLPIALTAPVEDQVRALFGPGVDPRFCVVRPDYVPEALQEAQHMGRISLTRGLDDRAAKEQVDVLVPNGEIIDGAGVGVSAFTGVARIEPRLQGGIVDPVSGSAVSLSSVVREVRADGWSWAFAAYGEVPRRQSVPVLVEGLLEAFVGAEPPPGEPHRLFVRPDADHDRARAGAGFAARMTREARLAAERRVRLVGEAEAEADRPLADGEDRPIAVWLDARTEAPLDTLPIGRVTDVHARATLYSRAAQNPVLLDVSLVGTLRVVDVLATGPRRLVRTVLDGGWDLLSSSDNERKHGPVRQFLVDWTFGPGADGARVLGVTAPDPAQVSAEFTASADQRHLAGIAGVRGRRRTPVAGPEWAPLAGPAALPADHDPIASLDVDADGDALAPGAAGRALAESVIAILGAELALPDRDPGFVAYATELLLAGTTSTAPQRVRATADWVMFHRRRTRTCVDERPPRPVRTRKYRLLHLRRDRPVIPVRDLFRSAATAADPFARVALLEFEEGSALMTSPVDVLRSSWRAADRGNVMPLAAVGDFGTSDGETIALARLATVRSALADLIDSRGVQVQFIPDVPPAFHEPGLDGVLLTVGVDRTCLSVYRVPPEAFEKVREVMKDRGGTSDVEAALQAVGVPTDVFVVEFDGDTIADPDKLRSAWAGWQGGAAVVGLAPDMPEADARAWEARGRSLAAELGGQLVEDAHIPVRVGSCPAVLVVAARPIGD